MKSGVTMIEMMVVIVIASLLTAFIYKDMNTTKKQIDIVNRQANKHIESIQVINRIEDMLLGCDDVQVDPDQITVIRDGVNTVYGADNIKSEVEFNQVDNKVLVNLGGEQYCIPIILKE